MASLQDAETTGRSVRWYCSCLAQLPATGFEPSGFIKQRRLKSGDRYRFHRASVAKTRRRSVFTLPKLVKSGQLRRFPTSVRIVSNRLTKGHQGLFILCWIFGSLSLESTFKAQRILSCTQFDDVIATGGILFCRSRKVRQAEFCHEFVEISPNRSFGVGNVDRLPCGRKRVCSRWKRGRVAPLCLHRRRGSAGIRPECSG